MAVLAVVGAWLVFVAAPRERERSLGRWRDQLSAMADDRKAAVDRWVYERFGDATLLAANADIAELVGGAAGQSGTAAHRQEVGFRAAALLDAVVMSYAYRTALVLDLDGRALVSRGQSLDLEPACLDLAKRVVGGRGPLADFHLHAGTTPLVQFAVLILSARNAKPSGVVLLVVDPNEWLYPFLSHQAVLSETAETLLVRRDGGDTLFLTPLRQRPDPPMTFRRSLGEPGFAAAAALASQSSFTESVDYRGVPVFASTRSLKGVPWGLVVKVDRAEALGGYRRWLAGTTTLLGALVLAIGGLTWGLWHRQRSLLRDAIATGERRLGELVQHANDVVFVLSLDGKVLQANERAEEMYGYSRDELRRLTVAELRAPEMRGGVQDAIDQVVQRGGVMVETVHRRRDGSTFPVEVSARYAKIHGERFLFSTVRDITERKRAGEELRASEQRLSLIFRTAGDVLFLLAVEPEDCFRFVSVNSAFLTVTGLTEEQVVGKRIEQVLPPTAHALVIGRYKQAIRENKTVRWEEVSLYPTGELYGLVAVTPAWDAYGVCTHLIGSVHDISEARRAEEALRASEHRYRLIAKNTVDVIWTLDLASGHQTYVSPSVEKMRGFTAEEAMAQPFQAAFTPESARRVEARIAAGLAAFAAGDKSALSSLIEVEMRTKDGRIIPAEIVATALTDPSGRVTTVVGVTRDISERKRAEDALRRSEERYRTILQEIMEAYFEVDLRGNITFCNDGLIRALGYPREEIIGLNYRSYLDEANRKGVNELFDRVYRTGEPTKAFGYEVIRKDGARIVVETSVALLRDADGRPIGFRGMVRDVTERKWLEEQLRQAQKIEAVGNLAGGIAHDFNNLLQAMLSQAQLVRSHAYDPEKVQAVVRELEQQVNGGASLTRQLLLFSRRETVKLECVDLNDAVRDATKILQRLVRANIALAIELAPGRLPVNADRGQLQQVLINLTLNASDAMPEGGRLTIRTGVADGQQIWLTVEDTGHGILEAIRERIFEPFFTTKEASKGTGLGLSVVHGIVTNCGGRIEVESGIGTGTTFKVILPRAVSGELPALQVARPALSERQIGRGERILIVEDEDATREALRDILGNLGYEVVAAGSGEEAGRLPADPPFDLLLTDLMLPGISGPDLIAGLRDRWPALKVILMSGYTEDLALRHGITAGEVRFLQKPFDMNVLAREVRAALDERPDSEGA